MCARLLARILFVALGVILAACGSASAPTQPTAGPDSGLDVGQTAPAFQSQLVGGQPISLESQRGKIVLLNFWATWCGPCREEMSYFQTLAQKYGEKDFKVLAINFQEKPNTISAFTDKLGLKLDVVLDLKGEINRLYGVNQYPVSFVVGRDGKILARQFGPFNPPEALDNALKKWIAGS
jgi:peroxiredoxin